MNKDQVAGAAKEAAGTVQKKFGQVVGSTDQTVKGAVKEAEGKTQHAVGDAKEIIKGAIQKP